MTRLPRLTRRAERLLWRLVPLVVCLGLLLWAVAPIVGAYAGSAFEYQQDGYGYQCSWPADTGLCVTVSNGGSGILPEIDTTYIQPQPVNECPSYPEGCSGPGGYEP